MLDFTPVTPLPNQVETSNGTPYTKLPPTLPIMEIKFSEKQHGMVERDLLTWVCSNIAPGTHTPSLQEQAP
jgi:hypothetical protein